MKIDDLRVPPISGNFHVKKSTISVGCLYFTCVPVKRGLATGQASRNAEDDAERFGHQGMQTHHLGAGVIEMLVNHRKTMGNGESMGKL